MIAFIKRMFSHKMARHTKRKELQELLKKCGLSIVYIKNTSITLSCLGVMHTSKRNKVNITDDKGNILETDIKDADIDKIIKQYNDAAAKQYPNLPQEQALAKYVDELVEINNLKVIAISDVNNALVDSKGFIRVFSDDLIEKYQKLVKNPEKDEFIRKGKESLRDDPKKQRFKYNNEDTPNVPHSDFGTSPTFKGMKAYLKNGKFGNGIIPKGAEKLVTDMELLVVKHQGEIRTFVTGNRPSDFKNCWRAMGVIDEKLINKYEILRKKLKLTWHHLDDLDNELKSTFQLVDRELHDLTTHHMGSHAQLIETYKKL